MLTVEGQKIMDTLDEIIADLENVEYEVLMPEAGVEDWLLTPIRVRRPGLQTLVDKMGTSFKCREAGTIKWTTAGALGFKVTYQRKNPAICKRRLQENGLNKPNFDANSMFG